MTASTQVYLRYIIPLGDCKLQFQKSSPVIAIKQKSNGSWKTNNIHTIVSFCDLESLHQICEVATYCKMYLYMELKTTEREKWGKVKKRDQSETITKENSTNAQLQSIDSSFYSQLLA